MSKAVISFRVTEDELAVVDRLAAAHGRSRSWMVNHLLREAAREELKLLEDVEEGIADLDAGRSISHEELVALLDARYSDPGREAA